LSGPPRAALVNYTVAVARAVARDNVTINNILPGMHHTDSVRENFGARAAAKGTSYDAEVQHFIDRFRIPANRFGNPGDVGAFVAILCSEFASYTTGQSLCIDGGVSNSTF
jgi:3-oxoacyl-[acyl-carrier protein] reductase